MCPHRRLAWAPRARLAVLVEHSRFLLVPQLETWLGANMGAEDASLVCFPSSGTRGTGGLS